MFAPTFIDDPAAVLKKVRKLTPAFKPAAKTITKWAGGKSWLVPTLAPIIEDYLDDTGGTYVEPFFGGGAMGLALGRKMFVSDVVEPLVEFFQTVQQNPGGLAWNLSSLAILGVDEESYYRVRDMRPDTPVGRAARFFYLNRIGFNGIYRENKSGAYNVPYGGAVYRKSMVGRSARDAIESLFPNREKIQQVSIALQRAEIACCDFRQVLPALNGLDLAFLDPPYDGVYDGYSKGGFGPDDQEALAVEAFYAFERGASIVSTNADTERIRYLYGEWATIVPVKEQRRISAPKATERPRAPCVLILAGSEVFVERLKAAF